MKVLVILQMGQKRPPLRTIPEMVPCSVDKEIPFQKNWRRQVLEPDDPTKLYNQIASKFLVGSDFTGGDVAEVQRKSPVGTMSDPERLGDAADEPNDAECEWESDDEKEDELSAYLKSKVKIEEVDAGTKKENEINKNEEDPKGIPNFWLTIFKNIQMMVEMVQEHDEPILKHLLDVKVIFLEQNPMGFVLEFHFSPNEYFTNSVLTKEYEMKYTPEEGDPFSFEGPEICKCKGCPIDWKMGKNVTVKTIKKKQKHKSRGSVRTKVKTVQNDSFFNFFSPPCMPENPEAEMDDETQVLLTTDFEIGHYIRERIVPYAVLYFTGEANIEARFDEEVNLLECKYHKLYEKRGKVISGCYEPNDADCEWESDDEKEDELSAYLKSKVKIEEVDNKNEEDPKGISNFWLTIFKNVQMLAEMVQEHDEPILKHLLDVKVIFLEQNPMGFVLEFHFSPNEYFTNSVLTKEYEMKYIPEEGDPFSFEGPEIYKCKGCPIDWKKGMNVTVKTIRKKQKHKSRGSVRTVVKTVQNDSFFNFFSPPCMPEDPEAEMDNETQALLTIDFEIGHYIRKRIVPCAVLYFTGETLEDKDYEEEEEGEEGEEEEDEDDANYNPSAAKNVNPADCKQQ